MTDVATALALTPGKLSPFDGRDVLRSTIMVTKAGDGLSEAMKIDPQEFHHGERVYVVLECEVSKVRFDPIKDTDALSRVHVLAAGNAAIVDEQLVRQVLDEQADRVQAAREAAAGVQRIPWEGDELDAVVAAHEAGEHRELVEGCPECDEEVAALEAEGGE